MHESYSFPVPSQDPNDETYEVSKLLCGFLSRALFFLQSSCSWLESIFPSVEEWQAKIYPFINTLLSIKENTTWMHTLPWAADSEGYFLWYLVS